MKYSIHEDRIEKLEKKITQVQRKCNKLGCEFTYEKLDSEIKEVEVLGQKTLARFVNIELSGTAKINDWEFIGVVEHTSEGNIIRNCTEYEVPQRYYTTDTICEHCNTRRSRKETCLVRNSETGEFKQVGKSCLQLFTNGISAEHAAWYLQFIEEVEECSRSCPSGYQPRYYKLEDVVAYALEITSMFGYIKSSEYEVGHTTKSRVMDYIQVFEHGRGGKFYQYVIEEAPENFKELVEARKDEAKEIIQHFLDNEDDSEYMHNLQVIAAIGYAKERNFGYVVSMVPTYRRHLENAEREESKKAEVKVESSYIGEVGGKVNVEVESWRCLSSFDTMYGTSFLYEFKDADGNIVIWSTGKMLNENIENFTLSGTVKEHSEFRGIKQTKMTRCRVQC